MPEETTKLRKILFNEVTAVVALISLTIGVYSAIKNPDEEVAIKMALVEQRLNAIEENHLTHIQKSLESLDDRTNNIEKNIATILALLSNAEIK